MNNQIFFFFYNLAHQSQAFDKLVIFYAEIFPYIVIALAGIFLAFHFKIFSLNFFKEFPTRWKEFIYVPLACTVSWLVAEALKILLHTPRPFLALPNVQAIFPETGFAFPSQHTIFFTALAVALYFYNKKVGYLFMFFALLIGLARITAGVHFPIDILGGFILGSAIAYFLKYV